MQESAIDSTSTEIVVITLSGGRLAPDREPQSETMGRST
jgi:hypothetical protein